MGCLRQFALLLLYFVTQVKCLLDIHELEEAKYGLEILDIPMTFGQEVEHSVDVLSKYGQAYRCSLPVFEDEKRSSEADGKASDSESEEMSASDVIRKLLSPMKGGCLMKTKGWWTYEFCYEKDIKQYHLEGREVLGEVVYLGRYSSEKEWANDKEEEIKKKKKFTPRFHSQMYLNGTVCDITNKPRKAQVKFLCENGVGDYIARIDEPLTCQYVIHVHTTHICHHPFFRQSLNKKARPIRCSPLLEDTGYDLYVKEMEEERKSKLEEMIKLNKQKLNKAVKEKSTLPYDSGSSSSDVQDMEPLYEAGDEDEAARQHEAAYDRKKQAGTSTNRDRLMNFYPTGDYMFKLFNIENKKEHTTSDDGGANAEGTSDDGDANAEVTSDNGGANTEVNDEAFPMKMDKVVQRVMNLLSELKDDNSDKTDENGMTKNNENDDTDDLPMDEEKADDQSETMVDDRSKWKVRVRKVPQEDAEEVGEEKKGDSEGEEEDEYSQMLKRTKKELETMLKKALKKAGVKSEGDIQVKFITTSGQSLYGITDGGLHTLSDEENEEFQRLLGNRAGAEREEARQTRLESNYQKVWNKKRNSKESASNKR